MLKECYVDGRLSTMLGSELLGFLPATKATAKFIPRSRICMV